MLADAELIWLILEQVKQVLELKSEARVVARGELPTHRSKDNTKQHQMVSRR